MRNVLFPVLVIFVQLAGGPAAGQTPETQPATPGTSSPGPETSAACRESLAELLRAAPDDTALVFAIGNWNRFATGLHEFGKVTGIEKLAGIDATGVLDELYGRAGRLIDPNGPVVFAISVTFEEPVTIAVASAEGARPPATRATELDDAVLYEFASDRHLAAVRGTTVVLARERSDLRGSLRSRGEFARRVPREVGRLLDRNDVVIYADAAALLSEIRPHLEMVIQAMRVGMSAAGSDAEMALRVWDLIFAGLRNVLSESRALLAAARVNGKALTCQASLELAPDGTIAKYLGQIRCVRRDLLRGLPAATGPLVLAFEWEDDPDSAGLFEPFYRALLDTPALRERIGDERIEALFRESVALGKRMPGSNLAYAFEPDARGLVYYGTYFAQDPPTVAARMRDMWDKYPEAINAWGSFPINVGPRELERVSGHELEVRPFDIDLRAPGRLATMQPILQAVYGDNPALYMATTEHGLAFSFGPRAGARSRIEQVLGASRSALQDVPEVRNVLKELPPSPQGLVLVDLPGIFTGVLRLAQHLGYTLPRAVLADTGTGFAAATIHLEARDISAHAHIPADAVRRLVQVVQRSSEQRADE